MNLVKKLAVVTIATFVLIVMYMLFVIFWLAPYNEFNVYESVIQKKYNHLISEDSPKIILIGGSNLAFGIDSSILEEKSGYKVVNLGLHAGMGHKFNTEISKANVKEGDIVVLAYEYNWLEEGFRNIGGDLVLTGVDNEISIYKHIQSQNYLDLLSAFMDYSIKKLSMNLRLSNQADGIYSSKSFDENGNMVVKIKDKASDVSTANFKEIEIKEITQDSIEYLQKYKNYVNKKNAEVYFTAPVCLLDMIFDEYGILDEIPTIVETRTGIKYISNPYDYMFEEELVLRQDFGQVKRVVSLV